MDNLLFVSDGFSAIPIPSEIDWKYYGGQLWNQWSRPPTHSSLQNLIKAKKIWERISNTCIELPPRIRDKKLSSPPTSSSLQKDNKMRKKVKITKIIICNSVLSHSISLQKMIKIKRRKNYHHYIFQLPPRTLASLAPKLDGLGLEVEKAQTYNQVMLLCIFLVVVAGKTIYWAMTIIYWQRSISWRLFCCH